MGVICFNNKSSSDYGIVVEKPPNYEIPEKDYNIYHVPGKNGDVIISKGSYQNVSRTYDIAVGSRDNNFTNMANGISEWLHSAYGYARLEDSYEPDYYRIAMYKDNVNIENILAHAGRATISFNCKPQRYLKSGEQTISMTSGSVITNPTSFSALPIIKIYGNGSAKLDINGYPIVISELSQYLIIDSTIQDVYKDTANMNSLATLAKGFPVLSPNDNTISIAEGITKVEIIPNWWTL